MVVCRFTKVKPFGHLPSRGDEGLTTEPFTPISRSGLADHTIEQIERLIIEGRLKPGQKLPSERELGAKLGVSRPTLREAIRALTMMGILEAKQGDGTYVLDFESGALLRPARVLLASKGGLDWLFETREILEGSAAALAALRATGPERDEVADWLRAFPSGDMELDEIRARDVRLHSLIITATRNPLLSAIVASLGAALAESRAMTGRKFEWEVLGMMDVKAVAEAILQRDPDAAQRAMVRHLQNARQRYEGREPGAGGSSHVP
jgi:GntR family transcriptional regulator, transcriptional repressor for pyruvate dehydrogenase complex